MTGHTYKAYGLNIRSALDLHDLAPPGEGPADVTITLSRGADLKGKSVRFTNWQASPGRFLMEFGNVARFLVIDGHSIHIESAPGVPPEDLVTYLLGSPLAALLHQRRILPLHASAVRTDHGAVLIAAASGVGKSTLAAALQARGMPQLADDVTGVYFNDQGKPMALPAFPVMRLWPDSVKALGRQGEDGRPVRAKIEKVYLPITNFCADAQPMRGIIALSTHNRPEISMQIYTGKQRAAFIFRNTFRKRVMIAGGQTDFYFQTNTALASQVKMAQVRRPSDGFELDALADTVIALLRNPADWADTPSVLAS